MRVKNQDINVFTGPGRRAFEFYMAVHLPSREEPGKRKRYYVQRLAPESEPGIVLEFALTEDLFLSEKYLIFPDYDNLRKEFWDLVGEITMRREELKATVVLPVKNPARLKKIVGIDVDIVEVGESTAKNMARLYVEDFFGQSGINLSSDVIEILTVPFHDDPYSLMSEVEKISLAFKDKKEITEEDLKKLSFARPELEIFKILKDLTKGNIAKGVGDFYRYIHVTDDSELLRVLGALKWALKRDYDRTKGKDKREKLLKLLFMAGEIDLKIKGESRLPGKDVFLNSLVYMADILRS